MTKKIALCFLFFVLSPAALFFSVYFLGQINNGNVLGETVSLMPASGRILASSGENENAVALTIISKDSTPIIIKNYLSHFKSPLVYYSDKIIEEAAKYKIAPQLIVAIAQQESNLGKASPEGCFNAWGWGIHARGTTCFANWNEAIEVVTKGIAQKYCAKGYCEDPCVMMQKYTPKSNGSWCAGIKQFLAELEYGEF